MITRQGLWEEIAEFDGKLKEINEQKAAAFDAYREQLESERRTGVEISAEIKACKKAFKQLRALLENRAAVEQHDSLVDEILAELDTGTEYAPRARASRVRDKTEGRSNAGPAHSAPLAATVGDDRGNDPVADTNSDALAVQPSPNRNDSSAAAGAPSVPAAPIRESEPVVLPESDLGRLDAAGNTALHPGSPPIPESAATSSAPAASLDSVPTLCGAAPIFDGDIRGTAFDRSLWV